MGPSEDASIPFERLDLTSQHSPVNVCSMVEENEEGGVQKVVFVCYVAVACHKLRSVLLEIAVIFCVNAEAKRKGI